MDNLFQVPSTIQSVRTLVDGGNKLEVITQELSAEELTRLFQLKGEIGWFLFKGEPIKPEEVVVPEFTAEFKGSKTPAQRLRNVLFVFWEQNGSKGDFDSFYKKEIEKLIDKVKEKLDE